MTDFVVSAPSQKIMYNVLKAIKMMDKNRVLSSEGNFPDGTSWAISDHGARTIDTFDDKGNLSVSTDGLYYVIVRWNGEFPIPSFSSKIKIVWSSDAEIPTPYPVGLPRFG